MAASADLISTANLCDAAAKAAGAQQNALGPRPADPTAGAVWDAQNSHLQHNINTLNNLASSLAAQVVNQALSNLWPTLQGLSAVTANAQTDIGNINSLTAALNALAAVISFGVAVATLAANPSVAGAQSVVTAFNAMKAAL